MKEIPQRPRRIRTQTLIMLTAVLVFAVAVAGTLVVRQHRLEGGADHGASITQHSTHHAIHVATITSPSDYNGNGVDDYTDIVNGARAEANNHPTYDDGYYQGGYPPKDRGACTDLVWRAFDHAGFDLKAMVDADIVAHPEHYPATGSPDPNIDFRRVGTLDAFFAAYGQTLTTQVIPGDDHNLSQWQPGDIVVFEHTRHIGIVSNKRSDNGVPYLLHNNRHPYQMEEDYLDHAKRMTVTGHYRFDATKVPSATLRPASR